MTTRVKFGDVVKLSKERSSDPEADGYERYIGLEHIDPGELRVRRWGDIADGVTFTNVFHPGQVLFGKRRAYQRKVAVADFSGVCSSDIYALEPKDGALLSELLPFICQTEAFFEHAVGTSAGSLSPRTNWKSLATFEFALPPIEEQRWMVGVLESVEALLNDLRQSWQSVEVLRRSSFLNAISSDVIKRKEVGSVAEFSSGKTIRIASLPKFGGKEHSIPVIGGNGIAGYTATPLPEAPIPCIAIGRVGEYCGAVHLVSQPCWVSDNALFVKSHSPSLRTRYLELSLRSLRLNGHSTGGAQPLMTQAIIKRLEVPVPELGSQDRIIALDDKLLSSGESLSKRMRTSEEFKRRLLQEFFKS